jgi:hypothetical protein
MGLHGIDARLGWPGEDVRVPVYKEQSVSLNIQACKTDYTSQLGTAISSRLAREVQNDEKEKP